MQLRMRWNPLLILNRSTINTMQTGIIIRLILNPYLNHAILMLLKCWFSSNSSILEFFHIYADSAGKSDVRNLVFSPPTSWLDMLMQWWCNVLESSDSSAIWLVHFIILQHFRSVQTFPDWLEYYEVFLFDIPIYKRNVSILVKTRSQTVFTDKPSLRYGIFFIFRHFQPSCPVFSDFQGDMEI